MKKLLSAIWAKALAFLLTPLAGVAAVNGVSEVIMVYFYDVWSPHPVWLLVVTVLCAVVTVGSLLFSLSAAGHWPGHEGIHLTWLDRIPLDVFVLALAGEWLIYGNASYYPSSVLGMVVFVALAYLFILAFTARCKASIVLADLVVLRLLRPGGGLGLAASAGAGAEPAPHLENRRGARRPYGGGAADACV